MTSTNGYQPRAEDKFSFGLWTVGNSGRDAFGAAARPKISPIEIGGSGRLGRELARQRSGSDRCHDR